MTERFSAYIVKCFQTAGVSSRWETLAAYLSLFPLALALLFCSALLLCSFALLFYSALLLCGYLRIALCAVVLAPPFYLSNSLTLIYLEK
jgi:hypothetical protein